MVQNTHETSRPVASDVFDDGQLCVQLSIAHELLLRHGRGASTALEGNFS